MTKASLFLRYRFLLSPLPPATWISRPAASMAAFRPSFYALGGPLPARLPIPPRLPSAPGGGRRWRLRALRLRWRRLCWPSFPCEDFGDLQQRELSGGISALAPRVLPAALLEGDDFRPAGAPGRALPRATMAPATVGVPRRQAIAAGSGPEPIRRPNSTISPGLALDLVRTLSTILGGATRYCLPPVFERPRNTFCPRLFRSSGTRRALIRTGFLQSFLLLLEARADRPQQPPATRRGSYGGPPSRCQEMRSRAASRAKAFAREGFTMRWGRRISTDQ